MTWANANDLGSDELAAKAADLPFFVPYNVLRNSTVTPEWRTSHVWASGSDQTNGAAYGWLAYDGKGGTQTRPTTTGSYTSISLIFNMTPSSGATGQIDTIAILNHNFADIAQLTAVTASVATGSDWTGQEDIASWSSFDSQRLISVSVSDGTTDPKRLHSVQYFRIHFAFSSAPSIAPALGELWVGRRYQFTSKGRRDFPRYSFGGRVESHETLNGDITKHELFAGRYEASISWTLGGTLYSGIDQVANALSVIRRSSYGSHPVLYVESPTDDVRGCRLVHIGSDTSIIQTGPLSHEVTFDMTENPPFLDPEVG